ncbi:MAG: SpoIID/LytB domain-containing protein [Gaiellaceae bacterium]|jgi:stage II sporulation protein D
MARRALASLLFGGFGLVLALAPVGAVAGSARTRVSSPTVVWSPATFVVSGHGWGHGVGLSQYGAYGFALHGYTYDQIIAHYFPGTDLESAASRTIKVLLADGRPTLTISSKAPFSVTDSGGSQYDVADLSLRLDPSLTVNLADGQGSVALSGPLLFKAGSASTPLTFAGRSYRGTFRVSVTGSKLRLVNNVGLESYLYGVVPCESPHDWPADALEAQSVVARTYALASIKPGSSFDVYADTRSQVYHGRSSEYPESTAAVEATAGETVYYDGKIATTFFFSTSGGRTAAIQDAWPGAQPVPYLVSVNDPYDSVSPYHNWGPITLSAQALAKSLGIKGPISDLTTKINGSRRVSTATLTGAGGASYEISGDSLRRALGLRSTWFTAKVLALQHPSTALGYGASIRILGRARNTSSPTLEMRTSGSGWQTARTLSPDDSGSFSVLLRPRSTSFYRISDGTAVGALTRIPVAAAVRMTRTARHGLRGSVQPAGAGARVELQRLGSGAWKTISQLSLGSSGGFVRPGVLPTGQYRARVTGLPGLVAGFSPVVVVG